MADPDDTPIDLDPAEWAEEAAPTVLDAPEAITAPHPLLGELAAAEVTRMRKREGERRDWFREGQEDALVSLESLCARRGWPDAEITTFLGWVRDGLTLL